MNSLRPRTCSGVVFEGGRAYYHMIDAIINYEGWVKMVKLDDGDASIMM